MADRRAGSAAGLLVVTLLAGCDPAPAAAPEPTVAPRAASAELGRLLGTWESGTDPVPPQGEQMKALRLGVAASCVGGGSIRVHLTRGSDSSDNTLACDGRLMPVVAPLSYRPKAAEQYDLSVMLSGTVTGWSIAAFEMA